MELSSLEWNCERILHCSSPVRKQKNGLPGTCGKNGIGNGGYLDCRADIVHAHQVRPSEDGRDHGRQRSE